MSKSIRTFVMDFLPEAVTVVVVTLVVWFFMANNLMNERYLIQPVMWGLMLSLLGITAILFCCKKLSYQGLIALIMLGGIIMRIGFILYKPTYTAYQDLGEISREGYGHASYVLTIFETGALPNENFGQYYHTPFAHILYACVMKVTRKVLRIADTVTLFEATKIVSCSATCFTLWFSKKIFKELELGKTATVIALTICAFLPIHYMLSGWINNDAVVTFFMTWILLYTIRWYKKPTYLNTVMLAFGFGLGIFTKISCAMLAFFSGTFMLVKFWHAIRAGEWKMYVIKFSIFACIAFPIGLYAPIRNYVLFGQGLDFVLVPGENIYCGDHGFLERFVFFPVGRLLDPIYLNPFEEYNLNFYLLKSSVVGEFKYNHVESWPAYILVICNLVLVLQAVFSCIVVCARNWKAHIALTPTETMLRIGVPALWVWMYLNLVVTSIKLPYGCTMDFRYIVPTALIGSIYLGIYIEDCCKGSGRIGKVFAGVGIGALILLTVAGMYMFSNMFKF